ncbi:MAG: hypothetical protein ABIG39_07965 [Candidatus Micrarchaeota archaeon]
MKMHSFVLGIVLIVAVLTAAAFADVQVSSSSVSPTTLRPGLTGSISFTLSNTGTSSISGVTLYPSGNGFEFLSDKVSLGTIGASGSTQANIPFKVKPNAESGIYNIIISIYWSETTTSGGTGYKTIQIPVTITKQTIFGVSSEPVTIGIGDDFEINASINNKGGKASNLIMSINSQYFILKDSSQLVLGDIGAGETMDINVPLSSNLSMPAGKYSVPILLNYQDELGNLQQTTATLGTIQAVKGFVDFSITPTIDSVASPGRKIEMSLSVRNDGTIEANSVRCTISSLLSDFLPIGSSQQLLGDIKQGESVVVYYDVGISATATPGYYPVAISLDYLNKQGEVQTTITKNIGIEVTGVPKMSIITSTSPSPVFPGGKYSLNIQVSNVGTTNVKSLTVHIEGESFTILENSPSKYIGTLKTDDYSEVSYDVFVGSETAPGKYPVKVTMEFLDTYNTEGQFIKETYVHVISKDDAAGAGSGGMDMFSTITLLVLVAVIAYLVYRRFFKKKKNNH